MEALGWEKKYFPSDPKDQDTQTWNEFLDQARDLTERGKLSRENLLTPNLTLDNRVGLDLG